MSELNSNPDLAGDLSHTLSCTSGAQQAGGTGKVEGGFYLRIFGNVWREFLVGSNAAGIQWIEARDVANRAAPTTKSYLAPKVNSRNAALNSHIALFFHRTSQLEIAFHRCKPYSLPLDYRPL